MDILQEGLNGLIEQGYLSVETLSKITKLNENDIEEYVSGEKNSLSFEKRDRLMQILMMLREGMEIIEDNDRVNGIIDVLKEVYKMDDFAIAHYANVEEQTLYDFRMNPQSISYEIRYKIAVRVSMLHYVFK